MASVKCFKPATAESRRRTGKERAGGSRAEQRMLQEATSKNTVRGKKRRV